MPHEASLPASYFDDVYGASADPWGFETSPYEAAKYDDTVAALGGRRFESGFEIGCSIGVLTQRLAARCGHLLAVDVSDAALDSARRRCAGNPAIEFRRMQVPAELPPVADDSAADHGHRFDLVVMSEVGYYWTEPDLNRTMDWIEQALWPGGQLLMVHWTPEVADYPLRGDQVHEIALARSAGSGGALKAVTGWRQERCRLDLFERR